MQAVCRMYFKTDSLGIYRSISLIVRKRCIKWKTTYFRHIICIIKQQIKLPYSTQLSMFAIKFNLNLRVRDTFKFLVAKLRETLPRVFIPAENDSDKISGRFDRYQVVFQNILSENQDPNLWYIPRLRYRTQRAQ